MSRKKKRESEKLLEIGREYIKDDSVPVPRRINNWRIFLREYRKEKEKIEMEQFQEINGFAATDDDAKRKLINELFCEIMQRYPKDDDERNEYTYVRNKNGMMKIGWRPLI